MTLRSCGSRGDEGEVTSKHVHRSTLCRRGGLSSTPQQHPRPPPEQHILPGRLHAQQDSRAFTEMLPCAIWLTTGPASATTPNEPNCRHFLPRLLPERDLRSQSVSATRCVQIPRTPIVEVIIDPGTFVKGIVSLKHVAGPERSDTRPLGPTI